MPIKLRDGEEQGVLNFTDGDKENVMPKIEIKSVKVSKDRKARGKLDELKASIETSGLIHPITLDEKDRLVSGYNRLAACKELGWEKISFQRLTSSKNGMDQKTHARLVELDENLVRTNLTVMNEGRALKERKKIYEELFPESKKGGDVRKKKSGKQVRSFTEDTAAKTGKSRRTIERGVQIASKLCPKGQKLIDGTKLANNKRELLKISKLKPLAQLKRIKEYLSDLESGKQAAKTQARRKDRKVPFDVVKTFFSQVNRAIKDTVGNAKQQESLLDQVKVIYKEAKEA